MSELKDLKLGLFSYSYRMAFGSHDVKPHQPMTLFEYIAHLHELGFDGIQIDLTHLTSHDPVYLKELRSAAEERNLFVEYGSAYLAADTAAQELQVASLLGAPLMRTFMGFSRFERGADVAGETTRAVTLLRSLAPQAADLGIRIALENHCDATTPELQQVIERVDSPTVGVCVDLGNFMIHLENPVAAVKQLAPYIINTHFKDYDMKMENWGFKSYGVALGEGVIDLKAVLDILVKESRLDRIMLEIVSEPQATEAETLAVEEANVQGSYRFAREVLGIGTG